MFVWRQVNEQREVEFLSIYLEASVIRTLRRFLPKDFRETHLATNVAAVLTKPVTFARKCLSTKLVGEADAHVLRRHIESLFGSLAFLLGSLLGEDSTAIVESGGKHGDFVRSDAKRWI